MLKSKKLRTLQLNIKIWHNDLIRIFLQISLNNFLWFVCVNGAWDQTFPAWIERDSLLKLIQNDHHSHCKIVNHWKRLIGNNVFAKATGRGEGGINLLRAQTQQNILKHDVKVIWCFFFFGFIVANSFQIST